MKNIINLIIDGIAPEKVMYDTDNHSLVVLYPEQKEFKKGDVLKSKGSDAIFILDAISPKHEDEEWCSSIIGLNFQGSLVQKDAYCWGSIHDARLATPEEQQILFDALAKEGKKWNAETLQVEDIKKEFKKGDIVFHEGRIIIVKNMTSDYYVLYFQLRNKIYGNGSYGIPFSASTVRLATPEEQQILFDALKKEGKKWNAETLQVEDIKKEFKRGDILASDDALLIFDKYEMFKQEKDLFHSIWNNWGVVHNKNWTTKHFKHATGEQIAQLHKELREEGKKWNEETLKIEDLDISDIVVDLETACEYLDKTMPIITSMFTSLALEDYGKFHAQITLQLIREAWNKFDGFVADYANSEQYKYFPVLDVHGDIKYLVSWSTTHIGASCYSFPTKARALQFGTQFKELLKTAMGI